jgi:predicted nuclease of predicted toxin-antitoxin system
MKLLFDENLSPKLPHLLADIFPNSLHVRDIRMKATIDPIVWDYAKDNDLMIVSKDSDMHDLSLVFGNPPKVIWLRLVNCLTSQVANLLRRDFDAIQLFYQDEYLSLIALSSYTFISILLSHLRLPSHR